MLRWEKSLDVMIYIYKDVITIALELWRSENGNEAHVCTTQRELDLSFTVFKNVLTLCLKTLRWRYFLQIGWEIRSSRKVGSSHLLQSSPPPPPHCPPLVSACLAMIALGNPIRLIPPGNQRKSPRPFAAGE